MAIKVNQRGIIYGKAIKQDDMINEFSLMGDKPPRKQGDVQIRLRGSEGHSIYIEISYNRYKNSGKADGV